MKPLADLVDPERRVWKDIERLIEKATNRVEILETSREAGERSLHDIQVTTHSALGALAYETGGILIDHGWIRLLGAGCDRLPRSISDWNQTLGTYAPGEGHRGLVIVADDVLGGTFALNGGALGEEPALFYHSPDTLEWERTLPGYSNFIAFCLGADLDEFYEGYRWSSWKQDVEKLHGDQGFCVIPPLHTEAEPGQERMRRPVPMAELAQVLLGPPK